MHCNSFLPSNSCSAWNNPANLLRASPLELIHQSSHRCKLQWRDTYHTIGRRRKKDREIGLLLVRTPLLFIILYNNRPKSAEAAAAMDRSAGCWTLFKSREGKMGRGFPPLSHCPKTSEFEQASEHASLQHVCISSVKLSFPSLDGKFGHINYVHDHADLGFFHCRRSLSF